MITRTLEYKDQAVILEGFCAYKDNKTKKPLVLIAHDWTGRTDFTANKAEQLAELGYVGFALDMYGKGKVGATVEEKKALSAPFFADRGLMQSRMQAALQYAKTLDDVDTTKIAVIGFCFGGTCALDLARTGADLAGVVSFHGGLQAPDNLKQNKIKAKLLVLHGYDDPMVSLQDVSAFEAEMTEAKLDWQVHVYSNAMHAFTNPKANDPVLGTVYNKCADQRSWQAMKNFLAEIFTF